MQDRTIALAGVRQFLTQPPHAQTPELLLIATIGGITEATLQPKSGQHPATILFVIPDSEGHPSLCKAEPGTYALLSLILIFGQSAFIDRRETGGKPYLKVFGRNNASAGMVFGRIVAELEAGEAAKYGNGDPLDLAHCNVRQGSGYANRGTAEWISEALYFAQEASDELLAGSSSDKVGEAKRLFEVARERQIGERKKALATVAGLA